MTKSKKRPRVSPVRRGRQSQKKSHIARGLVLSDHKIGQGSGAEGQARDGGDGAATANISVVRVVNGAA
jgi:hypothetical protein